MGEWLRQNETGLEREKPYSQCMYVDHEESHQLDGSSLRFNNYNHNVCWRGFLLVYALNGDENPSNNPLQ